MNEVHTYKHRASEKLKLSPSKPCLTGTFLDRSKAQIVLRHCTTYAYDVDSVTGGSDGVLISRLVPKSKCNVADGREEDDVRDE